jgi:hypothetical protein
MELKNTERATVLISKMKEFNNFINMYNKKYATCLYLSYYGEFSRKYEFEISDDFAEDFKKFVENQIDKIEEELKTL